MFVLFIFISFTVCGGWWFWTDVNWYESLSSIFVYHIDLQDHESNIPKVCDFLNQNLLFHIYSLWVNSCEFCWILEINDFEFYFSYRNLYILAIVYLIFKKNILNLVFEIILIILQTFLCSFFLNQTEGCYLTNCI